MGWLLELDGVTWLTIAAFAVAIYSAVKEHVQAKRRLVAQEKLLGSQDKLLGSQDKLLVVQVEQNKEQARQLAALQQAIRSDRRRFSWEDIHEATRGLAKRLDKFQPDCLLVGNGSPLLVASLAVEVLHWWLPVYPILTKAEEVSRIPDPIPPDRHVKVETARRNYYLPQALFDHRPQRIAILDDVAFDTLFFHSVVECLKSKGYQRKDLLTATLIASRTVLDQKVLDWTSETVSHFEIVLPWGRERANEEATAAVDTAERPRPAAGPQSDASS